MKKYQVVIPPPKMKSLLKTEKVLHVEYSDGNGHHYIIPADKFTAEFRMPEDAEYKYNTSVLADGNMKFDVYVEYKSKNQTDKKYLVPELIK